MRTLLRDLRYAGRVMMRRPGMSAAAIVCLAVGIGATTVIYSLVDGVLLAPLPYERPDEIFVLELSFPSSGVERSPASGKEFEDFRAQSATFAEVAGIIGWSFNVTSLEPPQRLRGGRLSAGVFRILGVAPALGRIYTDEEQDRGDRLAVVSHGFWQRAFGGDPGILGRRLTLSQQPYEVIGVMPPGFQPLPPDTEVWVPLVPNPSVPRDLRGVQVLARLAPGVPRARARALLDDLEQRFARDHPDVYPRQGWGIRLEPLRDTLVDAGVERRLLAFAATALLVLVIACVNVANLLLAQASAREKEVALRAAFGAGRGRLVRQLLTESAALALAGGLVGLVLAVAGLRLVLALELGDVPRLDEVGIDARVLLFALAATLLTALGCGLVPALRLSGTAFVAALKEGGRSSAASGRHPLRSSLVVAELALAGIVLIGTGLMLRTYGHLRRVDPGFRTAGLVAMRIFLPYPAYAADDARVGLYDRLRRRLAELPGIDAAALTSVLPLSGFRDTGQVLAAGQDPRESWPQVSWTMVGPGYFDVLGIPLSQGRAFADTDRAEAHPVAVVDEAMAARLWPGQDPIGRRLKLVGAFDDAWREVVGVVGRIRQLDLNDETEQLYLPFAQAPSRFLHPVLATAADPTATAALVRDALREIDPELPVTDVATLDEIAAGSLAGARFNLTLFALFGGAAFLLATVGIYGVIAYSVAQRRVEIGVRRALGARRRDVLKLIVGRGMALAAAGVALGLAAARGLAAVAAGQLAGMVHGVTVSDAVTYSLVGAVLLLTALAANGLPAYRAARVDPMRALREE